jgi:hypothetical protein
LLARYFESDHPIAILPAEAHYRTQGIPHTMNSSALEKPPFAGLPSPCQGIETAVQLDDHNFAAFQA